MKIIDAKWEKRNLGVTCYEIDIDPKDDIQKVKENYYNLSEKQYMVAKIPSSRYDLVDFFQKEGYIFIETAITLEHNLQKIPIPKRILNICDKCMWERMNNEDLTQLEQEVYKNIFKTDRIYIDSFFSKHLAAQRYDFWIKDLVARGDIPYKVIYGRDTIGFFLNKEVETSVYEGVLAATYSAYEGSGMGYCIQYTGIQSALNRGGKKYIGHVSANNPKVLKVLCSIGFCIKKMEHVFIKHN